MVIGNEKWVTYYNTVRKRLWSKCGEAAQTVAKPGLTAIKALLCIWYSFFDLRQKCFNSFCRCGCVILLVITSIRSDNKARLYPIRKRVGVKMKSHQFGNTPLGGVVCLSQAFCTQGCVFDPDTSRWNSMVQKIDNGHVV
ncbi:hypothetical protein TNCV_3821341 [Trichonephila clavipes]|nr:hypothetical protein TNCV_3821341 [Trichonephila clavipes]